MSRVPAYHARNSLFKSKQYISIVSQTCNPILRKQNRKIRRSKVPFVSQRDWNQPAIHYETIKKKEREKKEKEEEYRRKKEGGEK